MFLHVVVTSKVPTWNGRTVIPLTLADVYIGDSEITQNPYVIGKQLLPNLWGGVAPPKHELLLQNIARNVSLLWEVVHPSQPTPHW